MPRRPVYTRVIDVLERRISEGDYMLQDLPGERRLAEEVGVSYMTARKAVSELIERRVLSRNTNGTLVVHPEFEQEQSKASVALLTPAYPSAHFSHCRMAISRAAERHRVLFRPVEYTHWHDPAVTEALSGSDGLIVIPSTEAIPPHLLQEFRNPSRKVVFFDDDMTDHGLASIRLFSRQHIGRLYEHLLELGHRRIDCLNTQGHNREIDRRIEHWNDWRQAYDIVGELFDTPTVSFGDPTATAYDTMRQLLQKNKAMSALVCTTQPAALGAMRACYEAGITVGKNLSICTINNEPTGRFFCPSLTGLDMPDVSDLLERCFDWFATAEGPFPGELRMETTELSLFKGESTGPALVSV